MSFWWKRRVSFKNVIQCLFFLLSPNRDGTKGEQLSQNGLPSDQESPRVSYRSQTYQNYKNFISRRTANDRSWSGLWRTEFFAAKDTFLSVWFTGTGFIFWLQISLLLFSSFPSVDFYWISSPLEIYLLHFPPCLFESPRWHSVALRWHIYFMLFTVEFFMSLIVLRFSSESVLYMSNWDLMRLHHNEEEN